jgi:microcystin degradation protein MlrC
LLVQFLSPDYVTCTSKDRQSAPEAVTDKPDRPLRGIAGDASQMLL